MRFLVFGARCLILVVALLAAYCYAVSIAAIGVLVVVDVGGCYDVMGHEALRVFDGILWFLFGLSVPISFRLIFKREGSSKS